jgi:hypothetical protein
VPVRVFLKFIWLQKKLHDRKLLHDLNFFLHDLFDTFVPVRRIKVTKGDRLCSVRNWFDESVELAVNESDAAYIYLVLCKSGL